MDNYFKKENQDNAKIKKDFRLLDKSYKINKDENLIPAIIVDLDGTLSLINNRTVYDSKEAINDVVNESILDIINRYKDDHEIIIITGRQVKSHNETHEWLKKNNIKVDVLYMRDDNDYRQDSIIKLDVYKKFIKNKYSVKFVLEDRDQVVDMYRQIGLPCFQVYYGDF